MKSCSKFKILTSAVGIGFVAFVFYALTGARTIQWQDSAQFTYRICSGTLWNEYGLAMVHPLHFWLGRLMMGIFPGPDPWAVSLTSVLGGAVAVGLLFSCVFSLTGKKSAALFGALTLMLAHSFWRFSGLPEVYTWSAALLLGEVFFYLRVRISDQGFAWWGVFFVNGLALANHNMALLSTAVWGVTFLIWAKRSSSAVPAVEPGRRLTPFAHLLPIALCWILGALPYFIIIFLELKERAFGEVIHSALFGEGFKDQVTGFLPQPGFLLISLGFMLLSFPSLALPLAGMAAFKRFRMANGPRSRSEITPGHADKERGNANIEPRLRRGPRHATLNIERRREEGHEEDKGLIPYPVIFIVVLHLGFFLRYNVIDQYTFLIPVYALIALMAGVGFAAVKKKSWRRAAWGLLLLQPLLYAGAPVAIRQSGVLSQFERNKPYRDDYDYLFLPWQVQERSAERLAREAFETLGEAGSLVIEDAMFFYTAAWMREERGLTESVDLIRPDIFEQKPYLLPVVWVPARSDQEPPEGWRKEGEVWTRTRTPRADGG